MMKMTLVFFLLLATASAEVLDSAARGQKGLRKTVVKHESFIKALAFKHRLRVCNAYPYAAALDVYRGKKEKLTKTSPMAYQSCQDFESQLETGDQLEFKVGDGNAGTFSVSDLPENDAIMMLVIYRHDTQSSAVAFESHVFANLAGNAQLAVLDTYKGSKKSKLAIRDVSENEKARSEELRYESVVAVNPGKYDCILLGTDSKEVSKKQLVALNKENYVLIRSGVEAQTGPAYPEDLMIYPNSDESQLGSAAGLHASFALLFATMAMVFLGEQR